MKVIIGARKTVFEGWISTQEDEFNLLKVEDFERLFQKEKPEAFLAEHVWEHMTYDEGCIAAHSTDQLNPPYRVGEIIFDDEIPYGDEIRLDGGWVDLISSALADFIRVLLGFHRALRDFIENH